MALDGLGVAQIAFSNPKTSIVSIAVRLDMASLIFARLSMQFLSLAVCPILFTVNKLHGSKELEMSPRRFTVI